MKKGLDKIKILEIVLLISLLFNSFVFKIANTYVIASILGVFLIIAFLLLGFEKNNYRNKKDALLTVIISLLAYYFITYFLGVFFSFYKTAYSLTPINIIKNTFPVILIIAVSEILRYIILNKSREDRISVILCTIIFVLVDINASVHLYDVKTSLGLTKMICLVMFPSITKNIFLNYTTIKVGYQSALVYRYVMELNEYLLPIFPNFGEYINTTLRTVLPIFILFRLNNMFSYYEDRKITTSRYTKRKLILYSVITFSLLVIVVLTSGMFKYQALAIGSNSMSHEIELGDVVIVRKAKKSEITNIKKGTILVYNHDKKIIVHRIVKIINNNGKISFITKGDNNNANDSWTVSENDVIGTTRFKIKYIGMPTVMLNDLLSK